MNYQHSKTSDAFIRKHYGKARTSWIGKQLGVTKNVVIGRAFRLGLSGPQRRLDHDGILADYSVGMSVRAIGLKYGAAAPVVSGIANKAGLRRAEFVPRKGAA